MSAKFLSKLKLVFREPFFPLVKMLESFIGRAGFRESYYSQESITNNEAASQP